ncbi:NAD(P)/FAD-dependent oxidoreductase [Pseudomonas matsuisoli]|uniref:D-amino acid oxidase n=1 Tax=Pseudomonas matsuisoli TaxID=1515666 RepID=A0A917UZY6_9PSED|nr:FAD-dependent oxidoreductase [Pseudomonas matsuisoli]GGK01699.1 putative D-amino acid oxidase [Pseudomonas matsuisoli]
MFADVIVVGGGVIGMLSALRLAEAGMRVCVLDRADFGREASWAGGGIVSPLYPWRHGSAVKALAEWSQGIYPTLGSTLAAETGIDPEVYQTGLYWLDMHDEADALEWAQQERAPVQSVPIETVYRAVGGLGKGFSRAMYRADIANVRNPRLVQALLASLTANPLVTLLPNQAVADLIQEGSRVIGVRTAAGNLHADQVVIASGAWSASLLSALHLQLPVSPVKGQMILYKCDAEFLPTMVLARSRYAIPRCDGHVLVGSTLEHAGFDKTPTGDALASLEASALELLPGLANFPRVGHWAGLRPGAPEGIPFIGAVEGHEGLWLNCGHYRNGLVLAPASCQLLTDLMVGREAIIDPAPYRPTVERMRPGVID